MTTLLRDAFVSFGAEFGVQDEVELPLRCGGAGAEYEAARETLAIADGGDRGWLEMRGGDVSDFLQRLLSSDLRRLAQGGCQRSAMLDAKGKWIADLVLFRWRDASGEDAIGIDLPACRQAAVEQAFERCHFGERLSWRAPECARLLILGPGGAAEAVALGLPAPSAGEDGGTGGILVHDDLLVLRRPDRGAPCVELLGAAARVAELARALCARGAVPTGLVVLDILRVEAGEPRWGTDFDGESTLPESNEWRRASLAKGCYTGQEVVARVNTYGEAPRQLCRLRFDHGETPLHGCALVDADGKALGRVTSWVWSPLADAPIGLGVVRRAAAATGVRVWAVAGEAVLGATVEVPAKVFG